MADRRRADRAARRRGVRLTRRGEVFDPLKQRKEPAISIWKSIGSGDSRGLQTRWRAPGVLGRFDSCLFRHIVARPLRFRPRNPDLPTNLPLIGREIGVDRHGPRGLVPGRSRHGKTGHLTLTALARVRETAPTLVAAASLYRIARPSPAGHPPNPGSQGPARVSGSSTVGPRPGAGGFPPPRGSWVLSPRGSPDRPLIG